MGTGAFQLIRDLFRPRLVRVFTLGLGFLAGYDAASNQFEWPKLGKLLGMSGNLLPWWGWLLILQAIFVFGLFEYVRRNAPAGRGDAVPSQSPPNDTELQGALSGLIATAASIERQASEDRKQVATVDRQVRRLSAFADCLEARERVKLLNLWLEDLHNNLPKPPKAVVIHSNDEGPRLRAFNRNQREQDGLRSNVLNNLRAYGFAVEESEAKIEAEQAKIRGDSLYSSLLPDDQALIWNHDPRIKQEWHLRQVVILTQISYLERLIQEYTPRTQLLQLLQGHERS